MSALVKRQSSYLQLFRDTKSKTQRKALLDSVTKEQLQALIEITHNLLKGVLPLTLNHKKKLTPHRKFLRMLGDPKVNLKTKKVALCHRGNVIALLLSAVWPTLKTVLQ
jgi:hypothetical protein